MHKFILKTLIQDLDKSEQDINLIHYSPAEGLKTIEPKYHGIRGIGEEVKRTSPQHKMSFFYTEGTQPEDIVMSGAKSKYTTKLGNKKVYDIATDPEGLIANAKEKANEKMINRGVFTHDDMHDAIKSAGYHGFRNSSLGPQMGNVIAMYHPMDVEESSINFNKHEKDVVIKTESDLEKGIKSTIAGLGLVAGLGMNPSITNPSVLETPKEISAQKQESTKSSFAKFGTQPEDHFLHNIMQVETSGGKNLNHPKIKYGMHKGSKAVGKFALMPHTIKEIAKRYNIQGKSHPEIDAIHDMSTNQVSGYISKNPHVELELARTLANHVIKKHGGNLKNAAYAWKYGHNLNPKDINKTKLKHDPYLNNFESLTKGKSTSGLIPASVSFNSSRKIASIDKSENIKKNDDQQGLSLAPKQLTGPVETIRPQVQQVPKVKINPEHGLQIANAYDQMKHDPNHPDVKAAYGALINETKGQFDQMISHGMKVSVMKHGQENPYKSSADLHHDIEHNKHLWIYPTDSGFGAEGDVPQNHPLLQRTGRKIGDHDMLANDEFRAVHDYFGHFLGGKTKFGAKGEHGAYLKHKQMFSPLAAKALASETMGQNNWVHNSVKWGDYNKKNPTNPKFAEQKAGLLPDYILNKDWHQ